MLMHKKTSPPISGRMKVNLITNESIPSVPDSTQFSEKQIQASPSHSDTHNLENDESIIPNWTYTTDLGFIYNPIREKRPKVRKKPRDFHLGAKSNLNLSVNNRLKLIALNHFSFLE